MDFKGPENLAEVEDNALDDAAKAGRKALNEITKKAEKQQATAEDAQQAQAIADGLRKIDAERNSRMAVHEDILALGDEFKDPEDGESDDAPAEEAPAEEVTVEETVVEEEPEEEDSEKSSASAEVEAVEREAVAASGKRKATTSGVRTRTAPTGRKPQPPVEKEPTSTLEVTAAADVQGFAAGQRLSDMKRVAEAFSARSRGFNQPGTGASYSVAQIRRNAYEGLAVDGSKDDQSVIDHAGDEKRLKGGSLTAAAGWCAPSETLYDLCDNGASTEGMVDLPEVQVNRGGVRYTNGPDFSALYDGGFHLTEAQVIAGEEKTCIDIPCPPFEEVRLDAVGICLTSPILMERGYPELVSAFLSEAMVAHQWKVNGILLDKMVAAGGDPINAGNLGSVASGAMGAVELVANSERTRNRWGLSETVEAIVPHWAFGAMRLDYSQRTGVNMESVGDQQIISWFADRNISVKPVVGWQDLPEFTSASDVGYPATFQTLIYRSGTFVKGTQDVINLSAVHDSDNLKKNQYTALFFEEGVLLLQRCYGAKIIEVPVCAAGRTGAADIVDCYVSGDTTDTP